jgi:hypothetical protein|tara:strand:+ start:442 stop:627 length:186 start_codon:yes stop_codon:yes gene_type:complete
VVLRVVLLVVLEIVVRCIGVSVVNLVVVLQVGDWKIALWSGRGRAGFDRGFDTVYCVDEQC